MLVVLRVAILVATISPAATIGCGLAIKLVAATTLSDDRTKVVLSWIGIGAPGVTAGTLAGIVTAMMPATVAVMITGTGALRGGKQKDASRKRCDGGGRSYAYELSHGSLFLFVSQIPNGLRLVADLVPAATVTPR
ncbi:MAG: hypothetical protein ACJ8FZ_13475 [Bradyrhizobium sp.]